MKLSIRFSLVPGSATDLPIRMRVSYDGIRIDLRTGYVCPASSWNEQAMRMNPGTTNRYREKASLINSKLSEQESIIEKILTKYELEGLVPDSKVLKTDFERMIGRTPKESDPSTTAIEVYDRFMKEQSKNKQWTISTVNSYTSIRPNIEKTFGSKQISQVTKEDLHELSELYIDKGNKNSSTKRIIGYINSFINWCLEKDLYKGKTIKMKLKGTNADHTINYLEWHEVMKLYELDGIRKNEMISRDIFCFQCFTGLRTNDASGLKWSQVFLDADVPHMIVTTQKTSESIKIELNDFAISIIRRYIGKTHDHVFPSMCLRTKNDNLTRIAKIAGIDGVVTRVSFCGSVMNKEIIERSDAITTHWGRHSFIVHALSIGISPNVVMSWTGHNDYDAMRPYINIVDSVKVEAMKKFNEK